MSHTVHIYKDAAGEWRWTRTAANGDIVADSAEGYARKIDCVTMAHSVNGQGHRYIEDDHR